MFDQLQQTPDKAGVKSSQPRSSLSQSIVQANSQSDIPIQNFQQQSALDTLAEVSRHHLDYSSQRAFSDIFQDQRAESINEQAFIAQLRESVGISHPVTTAEQDHNLYLYTTDAEPHTQQNTEPSLVSTAGFATSPLVQAASAANQQLEQAQTQGIAFAQNGSIVDPQLDDLGAPLPTADQDAQAMAWTATQFGQPTFGTLSMPPNGSAPEFGTITKTSKQKTRSHFNDSRRKEVQEIRKRGACIRCRMLKKPCSEGTPCSTCSGVESARLWKGKCLRTRIADEFGLWSTSLFYSRAMIEVPAAVHGLEALGLPGRLEARLFTGTDTSISFSAKVYSEARAGVDPGLSSVDTTREIWLLDDNESIGDKLEAYVHRITDALIADERSLFIKATLHRAVDLVNAEEAEQAARAMETTDHKSPRSCYSLQNQLLKNVIELWVCTRLLTSPDTHALQLRYNVGEPPRHLPEELEWSNTDPQQSKNDIPNFSQGYQLIKAQLMASIESRCSKLSKTVMNELERRLLQRQQVSRFATFLSAVILLNVVELMTSLYRSFDTSGQAAGESPSPGKENVSTPESTEKPRTMSAAWGDMSYRITEQPSFWPLDTPPSALWPQGPHFADLLTMLLRMRALPPKTCQTTEGTLAALQDYSLPVHVQGKPVREQIDEQTKTAAEWLDPLALNVAELVQKRDGPLPGKDDGVQAWEMKFVAKVLLPERIR